MSKIGDNVSKGKMGKSKAVDFVIDSEQEMNVEFGGTLGTLKVTFLDGEYEGCVYEIPCDRGGRKAIIYPNPKIWQIEPVKLELTFEERQKVLELIRPYTDYVEVR